jgi:hypothetical protein
MSSVLAGPCARAFADGSSRWSSIPTSLLVAEGPVSSSQAQPTSGLSVSLRRVECGRTRPRWQPGGNPSHGKPPDPTGNRIGVNRTFAGIFRTGRTPRQLKDALLIRRSQVRVLPGALEKALLIAWVFVLTRRVGRAAGPRSGPRGRGPPEPRKSRREGEAPASDAGFRLGLRRAQRRAFGTAAAARFSGAPDRTSTAQPPAPRAAGNPRRRNGSS